MEPNGLLPPTAFHLGRVDVSTTVVFSLVVTAIIVGLALWLRPAADRPPRFLLSLVELGMDHLDSIMREMSGSDPRPYTPLIATLTVFIAVANLLGLVPGMRAPTADFSTAAALAFIVFLAVPYYGVRARSLRGYLRHYLEPSPLLLPLEIITELSRTLTLAIRLFGNMMSEELVIGVLLVIAALLVPVPIMVLDVLISVVQAYIFAVLVTVYLSAVVRNTASD